MHYMILNNIRRSNITHYLVHTEIYTRCSYDHEQMNSSYFQISVKRYKISMIDRRYVMLKFYLFWIAFFLSTHRSIVVSYNIAFDEPLWRFSLKKRRFKKIDRVIAHYVINFGRGISRNSNAIDRKRKEKKKKKKKKKERKKIYFRIFKNSVESLACVLNCWNAPRLKMTLQCIQTIYYYYTDA